MSDTNAPRSNGTKTGPGKPPVEHQFKPGNPGRPKGARSKLGEKFLEDLLASWEQHGIAAIQAVIKDKPDQYLKVVASILPKEIAAEVTHRYVARLPEQPATVDEWQKQHSPRPNQIQ